MHAAKSPDLRASEAILGLVLLPVAVWVWSMFLYLEIRNVAERSDSPLRYSRLPGLHSSLILGATLMSYAIIGALVRTFH